MQRSIYQRIFILALRGSVTMTQTKSQDEETVELIDLIYSLRNQFEASNHNSQHEQLKKNAVAQLHTYSRKLMLVGQDPNAAFWELVRRVSFHQCLAYLNSLFYHSSSAPFSHLLKLPRIWVCSGTSMIMGAPRRMNWRPFQEQRNP